MSSIRHQEIPVDSARAYRAVLAVTQSKAPDPPDPFELAFRYWEEQFSRATCLLGILGCAGSSSESALEEFQRDSLTRCCLLLAPLRFNVLRSQDRSRRKAEREAGTSISQRRSNIFPAPWTYLPLQYQSAIHDDGDAN